MSILCSGGQSPLDVVKEGIITSCRKPLMLHIPHHYVLLVQCLNLVENPPSLVCRANIVTITRNNCYWHVLDVLNWDISSHSESFVLRIVVRVLLESAFYTILKEMLQRLCREVLGFPVNVLLAPADRKMSTYKLSDLLPVRPGKGVKIEKITHRRHRRIESISTLPFSNIHLSAWGH